jgi:hypothetical protein
MKRGDWFGASLYREAVSSLAQDCFNLGIRRFPLSNPERVPPLQPRWGCLESNRLQPTVAEAATPIRFGTKPLRGILLEFLSERGLMKRLIFILTLLMCIDSYASQQRVTISRGFFTGKDYFEMSDTEKRAYVTGAINGMLVAPFFGAPEERLGWLKSCTGKLSDEQSASILSTYISNDPTQLNMSLNVVTFNALKSACDKMNP